MNKKVKCIVASSLAVFFLGIPIVIKSNNKEEKKALSAQNTRGEGREAREAKSNAELSLPETQFQNPRSVYIDSIKYWEKRGKHYARLVISSNAARNRAELLLNPSLKDNNIILDLHKSKGHIDFERIPINKVTNPQELHPLNLIVDEFAQLYKLSKFNNFAFADEFYKLFKRYKSGSDKINISWFITCTRLVLIPILSIEIMSDYKEITDSLRKFIDELLYNNISSIKQYGETYNPLIMLIKLNELISAQKIFSNVPTDIKNRYQTLLNLLTDILVNHVHIES